MAIKYAVTNGNWSAVGTWNGGILPGIGDDVFADGKNVVIDQNVIVASLNTSLRSGGTAGGVFNCAISCSITANVNAGSVVCLNLSHTGSLYIAGNIYAGGGYGVGITNSSTGSIYVTGNIYGGSNYYAYAITNSSTGSVYVTGNIYAGGSAGVYALFNSNTGNIYITGNVYASNTSYAIYCSSSGVIDITGSVNSSQYCSACYGISASFIVRGNIISIDGIFPVICSKLKADNTLSQKILLQKVNATDRYFYTAGSELGNPNTTDVRSAVVFGANSELTGSLLVPPASSVVKNVPVDHVIGTWDFDIDLITRLKNCATVESTGDQLAALTN